MKESVENRRKSKRLNGASVTVMDNVVTRKTINKSSGKSNAKCVESLHPKVFDNKSVKQLSQKPLNGVIGCHRKYGLRNLPPIKWKQILDTRHTISDVMAIADESDDTNRTKDVLKSDDIVTNENNNQINGYITPKNANKIMVNTRHSSRYMKPIETKDDDHMKTLNGIKLNNKMKTNSTKMNGKLVIKSNNTRQTSSDLKTTQTSSDLKIRQTSSDVKTKQTSSYPKTRHTLTDLKTRQTSNGLKTRQTLSASKTRQTSDLRTRVTSRKDVKTNNNKSMTKEIVLNEENVNHNKTNDNIVLKDMNTSKVATRHSSRKSVMKPKDSMDNTRQISSVMTEINDKNDDNCMTEEVVINDKVVIETNDKLVAKEKSPPKVATRHSSRKSLVKTNDSLSVNKTRQTSSHHKTKQISIEVNSRQASSVVTAIDGQNDDNMNKVVVNDTEEENINIDKTQDIIVMKEKGTAAVATRHSSRKSLTKTNDNSMVIAEQTASHQKTKQTSIEVKTRQTSSVVTVIDNENDDKSMDKEVADNDTKDDNINIDKTKDIIVMKEKITSTVATRHSSRKSLMKTTDNSTVNKKQILSHQKTKQTSTEVKTSSIVTEIDNENDDKSMDKEVADNDTKDDNINIDKTQDIIVMKEKSTTVVATRHSSRIAKTTEAINESKKTTQNVVKIDTKVKKKKNKINGKILPNGISRRHSSRVLKIIDIKNEDKLKSKSVVKSANKQKKMVKTYGNIVTKTDNKSVKITANKKAIKKKRIENKDIISDKVMDGTNETMNCQLIEPSEDMNFHDCDTTVGDEVRDKQQTTEDLSNISYLEYIDRSNRDDTNETKKLSLSLNIVINIMKRKDKQNKDDIRVSESNDKHLNLVMNNRRRLYCCGYDQCDSQMCQNLIHQ